MSSLADVRVGAVVVIAAQIISDTAPVPAQETLETVRVVLAGGGVAPVHHGRLLHLGRVHPEARVGALQSRSEIEMLLTPCHEAITTQLKGQNAPTSKVGAFYLP